MSDHFYESKRNKEKKVPLMEFWEKAFQEKQMMWGENATISAIETADIFQRSRFRQILIPGLGYGRNAKPFLDAGMEVTGIEISETAVALGKRHFGSRLRIVHGSVREMPFDTEKYDGVFSHALIHLFDTKDRKKLIDACFSQLQVNGMMVFTAITKSASSFTSGTQVGVDRFRTKDGVELFFYDENSIETEFAQFGLKDLIRYQEPVTGNPNLKTEFWRISCQRGE